MVALSPLVKPRWRYDSRQYGAPNYRVFIGWYDDMDVWVLRRNAHGDVALMNKAGQFHFEAAIRVPVILSDYVYELWRRT